MIHVEGLNVSFGEKLVLDDIFLRVPSGRIGVVLGKNGAGKSVLLKAIAGLVPYQRGTVNVVSHPEKKEIPALGAPLAYVFQKGGLFDSMDVFDNVAFGMRRLGVEEDAVNSTVSSILERVGLKGSEHKLPSELSGGMQKRVGLARALCLDPGVVLYDDPTAGLDPVLTDSIADLMLEVRDRNAVTSLVVTHDIKFAGKIADDVFLLYRGRFVFSGAADLFFSKENPFAAQFIEGALDGPIDLM